MAITKVKSRKLEFKPQALIELGVSAALAIVSIVLILLAVGRWRLKMSLTAALEDHDSNRPALVVENCRSALARDENCHIARQLLAKVLLDRAAQDPSKLSEAEKEYQALLDRGYGKGNAHVGLGVIALLRADAAADKKQARDLAVLAQKKFQDARTADPNCVEARIGLAHVDLFVGVRVKGEEPVAARKAFEAIQKDLATNAELRALVTREGLVDLYSGLGRAWAAPSAYSPEAAHYFRMCFQYAPQWTLPLVNLAYIDAQRLFTTPFEKGDLTKDADLTAMTQLLQALVAVPRPELAALAEAAQVRDLGLAYVSGLTDEDTGLFQDRISRPATTRWDALQLAAHVWVELVRKTPPIMQEARMLRAGLAAQALEALLAHDRLKDPKHRDERVVALNDVGVMLDATGSYTNTQPQVEKAETYLKEAIELDKSNFLLHRNLAIVQKRLASMEFVPERKQERVAIAQKGLEAAREAAGSDPALLNKVSQVEAWNP